MGAQEEAEVRCMDSHSDKEDSDEDKEEVLAMGGMERRAADRHPRA